MSTSNFIQKALLLRTLVSRCLFRWMEAMWQRKSKQQLGTGRQQKSIEAINQYTVIDVLTLVVGNGW